MVILAKNSGLSDCITINYNLQFKMIVVPYNKKKSYPQNIKKNIVQRSKSPKRKSPKRKSPKKKSPKRKSPKKKSPKRKSPKKKSPKKKSPKKKSPKKKSSKKKSPKKKSSKKKSPQKRNYSNEQARFLAENLYALSFSHSLNEKEKNKVKQDLYENCDSQRKCKDHLTCKEGICIDPKDAVIDRLLHKLNEKNKTKQKRYENCDSQKKCDDHLKCVEGICISEAEKVADEVARLTINS